MYEFFILQSLIMPVIVIDQLREYVNDVLIRHTNFVDLDHVQFSRQLVSVDLADLIKPCQELRILSWKQRSKKKLNFPRSQKTNQKLISLLSSNNPIFILELECSLDHSRHHVEATLDSRLLQGRQLHDCCIDFRLRHKCRILKSLCYMLTFSIRFQSN